MLYQRTPIFRNYGDRTDSGFAYFPVDGSTNYRSVMILSTEPEKPPVQLEGAEPLKEEKPLKFAIYDFHLPRSVSRLQPLRVSLKKNITKNDFVYDDKGEPVKHKPNVVYILEQAVEGMEYSSTPITDASVVAQLQAFLEDNLIPGQDKLEVK